MACAERGAPNEANHANHNLDAPARTWECVIPGIMDWTHEAQSKTQRKLAEMSVEPWTVFSDSCLSGYGVIVVPPAAQLYTGGILVCAGKWHYDEHINVLEARACKIGIEALPWQQEVTPLNIIVDNTALLGSGRKTRSIGYALNKVVGKIHECATDRRYEIAKWKYIGSRDNPADAPSRWNEREETGPHSEGRAARSYEVYYHEHVFEEEEIQNVIDKRDLL